MTPEDFTETLTTALGQKLESVVLYGSAVTGEHTGKRSNYNLLVVTSTLGVAELDAITKPVKKWTQAGNPPPLMFTLDRLNQSADVFPIELLDIKDAHKILSGKDIINKIEVSTANLRHQLESELKAKLIQLRESYLLTEGKEKMIAELMVRSIASFQVLFRGALRCLEKDIPKTKQDVVEALSKEFEFDSTPFQKIAQLKAGELSLKEVACKSLFADYLKSIEIAVDAIDALDS